MLDAAIALFHEQFLVHFVGVVPVVIRGRRNCAGPIDDDSLVPGRYDLRGVLFDLIQVRIDRVSGRQQHARDDAFLIFFVRQEFAVRQIVAKQPDLHTDLAVGNLLLLFDFPGPVVGVVLEEIPPDVEHVFLDPFVGIVGRDHVRVGQVLAGFLDENSDVIGRHIDDELRVAHPQQTQAENDERGQSRQAGAKLPFEVAVFQEDVARHGGLLRSETARCLEFLGP